jgi:hypothetical protein
MIRPLARDTQPRVTREADNALFRCPYGFGVKRVA